MSMRYPVNYIGISQGHHSGLSLDFGWSSTYYGQNQPVYACDSGYVYKIENQPNGGNVIYIMHADGIISEYGHLKNNSILVSQNEPVSLGQQIAQMGNTGNVSGNHLHFGLFSSSTLVDGSTRISDLDPFDYLYVYPNQIVGSGTASTYANYIKYLSNTQKYVYNVDDEGLNVRNKPQVSGSVILNVLPNGSKVQIYSTSGNWAKVSSSEARWVNRNYLTLGS